MEPHVVRTAVPLHELGIGHRLGQHRHDLLRHLCDRADRPSLRFHYGYGLRSATILRQVARGHLVGFLHQAELFVGGFLCLAFLFRPAFQLLYAPFQFQRFLVVLRLRLLVEAAYLPVDVPVGIRRGADGRPARCRCLFGLEHIFHGLPVRIILRHRQVLQGAHLLPLLALEVLLLVGGTLVRRQVLLLRHGHFHVEAVGQALPFVRRCEYQPHRHAEDKEQQRIDQHLPPFPDFFGSQRLGLLPPEFILFCRFRLFFRFVLFHVSCHD